MNKVFPWLRNCCLIQDVYKRQRLAQSISGEIAVIRLVPARKDWNDVLPVSYTHLDVYKRQKLEGKHLNRALRDEDGDIYDIVAGKFFLCGLGDENFASLPKELQQKYEEKFRQPEAFLKMGSKIMAIPTEPAKAAGKGKTAPVTER